MKPAKNHNGEVCEMEKLCEAQFANKYVSQKMAIGSFVAAISFFTWLTVTTFSHKEKMSIIDLRLQTMSEQLDNYSKFVENNDKLDQMIKNYDTLNANIKKLHTKLK